jgi:AraC-like DNA-binding protein
MGADGRFQAYPFWIGCADVEPMDQPHWHTDLEINYLLGGEMTYRLGHREIVVARGEFTVFWGGTPHRLARMAPGTRFIVGTLPLAEVLGWPGLGTFCRSLIGGGFYRSPPNAADAAHIPRWAEEYDDKERHGLLRLEVRARLTRAALEIGAAPPDRTPEPGHVEGMVTTILTRYREPLRAEHIAASVGLHPNYAMRIFRAGTGLTMHDFLVRTRVGAAERLLAEREQTVAEVARAVGFGAPSRLYAALKRHAARDG